MIIMVMEETSSRFSSNSEASASELLENFEDSLLSSGSNLQPHTGLLPVA